MAGLTNVQKQALNVYLTVKCRSGYMNRIPYDVVKEYNLLPDRTRQKEEEAREIWEDDMRNRYGNYYLTKPWSFIEQQLKRIPKAKDTTESVKGYEMDIVLKAIYEREKSIIRKVEEFIRICKLLTTPDNHIIKRSGQYRPRQVNVRTGQDMTNEIARKSTELPHYTAYAKLLPSWNGKIKTLPLEELHRPYEMSLPYQIPSTSSIGIVKVGRWVIMGLHSRGYMKKRTEIEQEIKERHDRLISGYDEEFPPIGAPESQKPMPVRGLRDIVSMRVARPVAGDSEDEPPSSHS